MSEWVIIKQNTTEKQLTVAELIEQLHQVPADALVCHEGCDCLGKADRVEFNADSNTVLIGRFAEC